MKLQRTFTAISGKDGCIAIELDLFWIMTCKSGFVSISEMIFAFDLKVTNWYIMFIFSPLPKNLNLPMENDRSSAIQCRVALSSLTSLCRNWSSFVLLENHSFIKFISRYCAVNS